MRRDATPDWQFLGRYAESGNVFCGLAMLGVLLLVCLCELPMLILEGE